MVIYFKDEDRKQIHKRICINTEPGTQRVNKCIPGIKGHVSRESVRGRFAEEKVYAAVEAVSVCARGASGCHGGQWALL